MQNKIARKIVDKLAELHGSDDFSIAFLPYKRSMWDSMESVYEECWNGNASPYIIPLPYHLMGNNGQVEKTVSERQLFEGAYDVTMLRAMPFDYVVIHYPYDGKNKVTRMLPEYYTAQLKNYGKVVYIPYSNTSIKFLRVQPGIANVDYVFLSTEADVLLFISEWAELGVNFSGRVFGFGSPKMDAIAKCKHEKDTNTVLVVNSLGAYLNNPFMKIDQYRAVIITELAVGHNVIFRPHPLLRQTIRSMRPDTEHTYIEFIEWAKVVGCYIDESEYLERELKEADMLISDPSSVVQLWATTGREYRVL